MRLATRLRRLEARAQAQDPPPSPEPPDEEQWLEIFQDWGRAGHFRHEPDFKTAIAVLREALSDARASTNPPFEPPEDFRPDDRRWRRLECWRTPDRFPRVVEGLEWLQEMRARINFPTPPVSEAEYRELEAWFRANEPRLMALERTFSTWQLPLGDGTRVACSSIRYDLWHHGPRGEGSGRTAEALRKLKARYGTENPA